MKTLLAIAAMAALSTGAASGQNYPNKPVRIVTSAVGGGSDFTARVIAQGISAPLGQPVIIENRGGPSTIGIVAAAQPDGYTLSVAGPSLWIAPLLRKTSPEMLKFFSPVTIIAREILMVAVNLSLPAASIKDLIALAHAKPGQINFGSGVVGSSPHLAVELFKSMAHINLTHVPYKSSGQAIPALISGEVQLLITDIGLLAPHVKSGKVKALAITSLAPSALAPGLPTVAASGLPGYESTGLTGLLAPATTPAAIISRLNQEIVRAINRPDIKEMFLNNGSDIVGSSPEQFAASIRSEVSKWSKVINDAGIKAD